MALLADRVDLPRTGWMRPAESTNTCGAVCLEWLIVNPHNEHYGGGGAEGDDSVTTQIQGQEH